MTRLPFAGWMSVVLVGLATAAAAAELPSVRVQAVREESSGGSFTSCSIGVMDGKKTFIKSNRGNPRGTRYANFESDILARDIFELVGVRCPRATMVRLDEGSPLRERLGSPVLAMEFVSTRLAGGRIYEGFWPGPELADVDEFIRLLVVDLLIGNADRRSANFFVTVRYDQPEGREEPGTYRPIPIDNNCGFGTMTCWTMPTSQMNFLPTYDGIADLDVFRDLGSIRNIVLDSPTLQAILCTPELRPRIREVAAEVCSALSDETVTRLVEALPREVIPRGAAVDPKPEWLGKLPAEARPLLFPMREKLSGEALFRYRKKELRETLAWRRDHLLEALEKHFAWRQSDPECKKADRERLRAIRESLERRARTSAPEAEQGVDRAGGDGL